MDYEPGDVLTDAFKGSHSFLKLVKSIKPIKIAQNLQTHRIVRALLSVSSRPQGVRFQLNKANSPQPPKLFPQP